MANAAVLPVQGSRVPAGTATVSFVIPVRNDANRLRRCLTTIAANTYPGSAVEIIVADNGSTDGSGEVAEAAGARVLSMPALPVSELRNRAAAVARGSLLAFVDADHEIAPTWIAAAVEGLAETGVGAVGALCFPPPNGTWVQRMYGALRGRSTGRRETGWLGAGNMALRREAFDAVGGFDSRLETCEDVDLCQKLVAKGWRVVADERLYNVHLGDPTTLKALFRGECWRGRDNLRVTFNGPLSLRSMVSAILPMIALAAWVAMGAALVAALFAGMPALVWGLAAGGVILALSILRTIRMRASRAPEKIVDGPVAFAQALAVALAYDTGRAAALVLRARHHRRAGA
jgi:hypothetical protein